VVPWGEMCTAELVPRDGGGRYLAVESGFGLNTGGEDDPWEAFKPRGVPAIELSSGGTGWREGSHGWADTRA
jgi:hypothetical protein